MLLPKDSWNDDNTLANCPCGTPGCRGFDVFNVGEHEEDGYPLGHIEKLDECAHFEDDDEAAFAAMRWGYVLVFDQRIERYFVVEHRDTWPVGTRLRVGHHREDGRLVERYQVRCECQQWVLCSGFTNTCHTCDRDYGMNGYQLAPRSQWGEETGESVADILQADNDYQDWAWGER
jgi:hypothetical protein